MFWGFWGFFTNYVLYIHRDWDTQPDTLPETNSLQKLWKLTPSYTRHPPQKKKHGLKGPVWKFWSYIRFMKKCPFVKSTLFHQKQAGWTSDEVISLGGCQGWIWYNPKRSKRPRLGLPARCQMICIRECQWRWKWNRKKLPWKMRILRFLWGFSVHFGQRENLFFFTSRYFDVKICSQDLEGDSRCKFFRSNRWPILRM